MGSRGTQRHVVEFGGQRNIVNGSLQELDNDWRRQRQGGSGADLRSRRPPRRRRDRLSRGRPARARRSSSSSGTARARDLADEQFDDQPAHRLDRLADRRQRRIRAVHQRGIVEANDRDIPGHRHAPRRAARIAPSAIGSLAQMIPVTPRLEQPGRRGLGRLERVERVGDLVGAERSPGARGDGSGGGELPARRHVVRSGRGAARSACGRARRRWPIACSTATASSHETRGKPRPSIDALTSTVGSLRSASRA